MDKKFSIEIDLPEATITGFARDKGYPNVSFSEVKPKDEVEFCKAFFTEMIVTLFVAVKEKQTRDDANKQIKAAKQLAVNEIKPKITVSAVDTK